MIATTNTMSQTPNDRIYAVCGGSQVHTVVGASELSQTVNLHVTRTCNFRCVCCWRTRHGHDGSECEGSISSCIAVRPGRVEMKTQRSCVARQRRK